MELNDTGSGTTIASKKFDEEPFIPECEVLHEGGPTPETLYCECKKNPGHPTFTPVNNLQMEHLPPELQSQEYMELIRYRCDMTVKIKVKYTSPNRPDTYADSTAPYPYSGLKGSKRAQRCGTGYIQTLDHKASMKRKPCPCHLCKESKNAKTEYLTITVMTATHVIYDDSEASKAVFECFYDSNDREGVKCLYGHRIQRDEESDRLHTDCCLVDCVTHDYEFISKLDHVGLKALHSSLYTEELVNLNSFIISHPHGMSKQISFGKMLNYTVPMDPKFSTDVPHRFEKDTKCVLPLTLDLTSISSSSHVLQQANALPLSQSNKQIKDNQKLALKRKRFSFFNLFKSSNKKKRTFQNQVLFMTSGKEYNVPNGTTFTIPPDSKYVYQFNIPLSMRLTLPPSTKFTLPDGTVFFLPSETEFYNEASDGLYRTNHCLNYFTYNIDTCPGSSGAGIFCFDPSLRFIYHPHAGALTNGTNISGLNRVFGGIRIGPHQWPHQGARRIDSCVFNGFFTKLVYK